MRAISASPTSSNSRRPDELLSAVLTKGVSKWHIKFSSVWYMGTNISEEIAIPFAGLNRCSLINTHIYP
jgi:hypothetical protein